MNKIKLAVASLAAVAAVVGAFQRPSSADAHCHNVVGNISVKVRATNCTSPVGLCTSGTIDSTYLHGTTSYVTAALIPAAQPGDSAYYGTLTLTTAQGTLTLQDSGVLSFGGGQFSEYANVISGTGAFAGATGTLFMGGFMPADRSGFDGSMQGQICNVAYDGD